MRIKILIALLSLGGLLLQSCINVPSSLTLEAGNVLNTKASEIILDVEAIESFRIFPEKDNSSSTNIRAYPIIEQGENLDDDQKKIIQSILLDKDIYSSESIKRCPFLPEYAFILYQKDEQVVLLLSPVCEELNIVYIAKNNLVTLINRLLYYSS